MDKNNDTRILNQEIAIKYYKKAKRLRKNDGQDIGEFRKLKNELMKECNVTEIEAINILNGFHISDYVKKYELISESKVLSVDANKRKENRELLMKIAELEDELKSAAMENEGLYKWRESLCQSLLCSS